MRHILIASLLSLFMITGTNNAYAERNRRDDRGSNRTEQRQDRHDRNDRGNRNDGQNRNDKGHKEKYHHKNAHPTPAPPPPYRPRYRNHTYYYPHYSVHDNLGYMVNRITGGARDVNVWQVDPGTYVVRFRKGRHMYAQYLYPYEGRYGERRRISLDWLPRSPWVLIPNVHININI